MISKEAQSVLDMLPLQDLPGLARERADADALSSKPMAAWLNTSGYTPTEFKVLIRPDEAPEKIGNIYVPVKEQEKAEFATTEGVIVATSHLAFTYAKPEEWAGHEPKAGDRVVFTKHSGVRVKGDDGIDYLLVTDREILSFRVGK